MKKFPEDIAVVNRVGISITPRQVLLDWVNEVDPVNLVLDRVGGTIYLLPQDLGDAEDIDSFVEKHFLFFFEHELNAWYTDENLWPKKLTYKMFHEWFDIEPCDMVFDTTREYLIKE